MRSQLKKIALLALYMLIASTCTSQEKLHFKVGYLPNHQYTLSIRQISGNSVKYIGSEEMLQYLESNGIANPTITHDTTFFKSISKTGDLQKNTFPVDVEMLESTHKILSRGTRYLGKCIDGNIKIDSISSPTMTAEEKNILLPAVESMTNQFKYPEKKMKVGQSFEQNTPIVMPIVDVTLEIDINSLYTLTKIENGIGFFDIKQVYSIKASPGENDPIVTGIGEGQIEYDMETQFFTRFYLEMEMSMTVELEHFTIDMKSTSITDQTTDVNKSARSMG